MYFHFFFFLILYIFYNNFIFFIDVDMNFISNFFKITDNFVSYNFKKYPKDFYRILRNGFMKSY